MLDAPIKHQYSRVVLRKLGPTSDAELRPTLHRLEQNARTQLAMGLAAPEMEIVREFELRHPGRIGAIPVLWPIRSGFGRDDPKDFRSAHQRLYGHEDATATIEVAALFVVGIGRLPRVRLNVHPLVASTPKPAAERLVYFAQASGRVPTHIHRGAV